MHHLIFLPSIFQGGGDTGYACEKFERVKEMSHVCTGGGASIAFLEGMFYIYLILTETYCMRLWFWLPSLLHGYHLQTTQSVWAV